jgi:hypothetical protein
VIKPNTLDYYIDVHVVSLQNLQAVLTDILERIQNGEFLKSETIRTYPIDDDTSEDPLS